MVERQQHTFASPELHWLNNALGPSHPTRGTTLMQNLLRYSSLFAHENSSKSSPHLGKLNAGSSEGESTRERGHITSCILIAAMNIVSATAVAPVERVHALIQCQSEMIKADRLSTPYKGMKDCLLRTIKHEGVLSLWRGNSLNVIGVCAAQALPSVLAHLPYSNDTKKKMDESSLWKLPFYWMPFMLCCYPLDYARVRLVSDVKAAGGLKFSLDSSSRRLRNKVWTRQFSGVFDVYKKTLKLDGIQGLYRGYFVSCIRPWAEANVLEARNNKEPRKQQKPVMLVLSEAIIVLYGLPLVLYPVHTVSRRMMMTSGEGSNKYRSVRNAFYQIVKIEGASFLFKGLAPHMVHLFAKDMALAGLFYMTLFGLTTLAGRPP